MKTFGLFILAVLLLSLTLSPLGHYLALTHGSPSLIALSIWGFGWFASKEVSYRWALIVGIVLDLVSYPPFFGFWTIAILALSAITVEMRERFFEVVSLVQSLSLLLLVLILLEAVQALVAQAIYWELIIVNIAYTIGLGAVIYYFVVVVFGCFSAGWVEEYNE